MHVLDGMPLLAGQRVRDVADAILERFEVTPKAVISARNLGVICHNANLACKDLDQVGRCVLDELAESGFKIVKVSE